MSNANNSEQGGMSKGKKIGLSLFIVGGLAYILNTFAPGLFKTTLGAFSPNAVANSDSDLPSQRATNTLANREIRAKAEANNIVREAGKNIVYEDSIVPPPPAYQTALQFDQIMSTYNLVTRINSKGKENAYVFAGLKIDKANQREVIAMKHLQASELAVDEKIAKHRAQIAKYDAGVQDSESGKPGFISASGTDATSDNLTNVLLGDGSTGETIKQALAQSDKIRLASIANSKAVLYINGLPFESISVGDTVNSRYEMVEISTDRQCVRLTDLKTEERDELAPICLH